MKKAFLIWAMGFTTPMIATTVLPEVPVDCHDSIMDEGYCAVTTSSGLVGPVGVDIFLVVSKSSYPEPKDVEDRYKDFSSWPSFAEASGLESITFEVSQPMAAVTGEKGQRVYRHFFEYSTPAPFPLPRQQVRGISYLQGTVPVDDALLSFQFESVFSGSNVEVPEGEKPLSERPMGLKNHSGKLHILPCRQELDFCSEDDFFLIYQAVVTPNIEILPSRAAPFVLRSIEAILLGMFLL